MTKIGSGFARYTPLELVVSVATNIFFVKAFSEGLKREVEATASVTFGQR